MSTLAVDVGGTRIKWSLFVDDARSVGPAPSGKGSLRTLGWLNHTLPDVFDPARSDSITHPSRGVGPFDRVAVSLCGEVDAAGRGVGADLADRGVPRGLADRIGERVPGANVHLVNDGEAWCRGAARLLVRDSAMTLQYPLLALIFGTGVACCHADDPQQLRPLDVATAFPAPRLRASCAAGKQPAHKTATVHDLLGRQFFDWIERRHGQWDRRRIAAEFSQRVLALLQDIAASGLHSATILVGGGNAELLSTQLLDEGSSARIVLLRGSHLGAATPDLIPLLGAVLAANERER